MLTVEQINRITQEETLEQRPRREDTPEERRFRRQVRQDIRDIREQGGEVQFPNE